ncbi:SDR family NAD(P)-dependent oxidoreductase [Salaquimonas pukyongi]|uniref:SDR family NAD(P)-dependent oxidoreductase n=1 Tax=Salaquimonas pukyongi TaxID=2712698 RepID=UPI00096BCDE8|nr:SDR family NAD(P)-dependent oxidoreductase [Salaquimonas pukyongi]
MTTLAAKRRRILVTGGTSGIGLELVRRWVKRHEIIATGRSFPEELSDLAAQNPGLTHSRTDQAKPRDAAGRIAAAITARGWEMLDHAVLNAGTGFVCDPADEDIARILETLTTNLTASMVLAHHLFPLLEKGGGTLTLIGSTAHRGAPAFASYAASKAGLNGFARSLREEWRGRVRVQILHPGPTRTTMHQKAGLDTGRAGAFFTPPAAMAAMIDHAIARRVAVRRLSFLRYWSGEGLLARGL